jgi:sugar lactone lactonase YvrE
MKRAGQTTIGILLVIGFLRNWDPASELVKKSAVVQAFRPAVTGRPQGLHYIRAAFFSGSSAGPSQSVPSTPATPLWTVTDGMDSPESVYFDADSGFLFVSQIGGQAAARDGNGRISKLTIDGRVIDADWVKGLNAPKGLRSLRGTLYAADLDEIVGIEIASGRITSRVKVDIGGEGKFFNDVAVAPDGTIYTSDSFGNRIFAIKDGQPSVFFEGDSILLPNGVLVDGNRLIVASDGRPARGGAGTPARLVAIDMGTKQLTQVGNAPIGTPDGIEKDGRGGYLISDVGGGRILQVAPDGEVRVMRQVAAQPADIAFIAARGLLVVPHLGLNRVSAYDLSDVSK